MTRRLTRLTALVLLLNILYNVSFLCAQDSFSLPPPTAQATWQAEAAVQRGAWRIVKHEWADAGAYIEAADAQPGALEFPFTAERACVVQAWPIWWRHGERKTAQRFPHPFQPAYGPNIIDAYKNLLFFTAPVMGRVGVVDAESEKFLKHIDLGGYLTDLIADSVAGKVYVSDAQHDRVIVLDATKHIVVSEIRVGGQPWHLALRGNRLFVGCMKGKKLVAVDTTKNAVIREIPLPFYPQQVEVVGKDKPRVVVMPIFLLFDPVTLKEVPPDRLTFTARRRRGVMCPIPNNPEMKRVFVAKNHNITTRVYVPKTREWIQTDFDVSEVTKSPKTLQNFTPSYPDNPGPEILDKLEKTLFFTSPVTGKVGVFDMVNDKLIGAINLGGYLTDLVADAQTNKVYVSDSLGNRVVIIDGLSQKIVGQVPVPELPIIISLYRDRLFVCCQKGKCIAAIDPEKQTLIGKMELYTEPLQSDIVRLDPPHASSQYFASEPDAPLRVGVRVPPLGFDVETLTPADNSAPTAEFRVKNFLKLTTFNPPKQISVDNSGVIRIDGQREIEVVSVIDPQLLPDAPPIAPEDTPGTITFSMDNGPAFDWRRNIWFTPDRERFLVNDTEEFWQWNAPRFQISPGRHVLKVTRHSPFARLDALRVKLSPAKDVSLHIAPEPQTIHSAVPLPVYQGVFYYNEPVRFSLIWRNLRREPQDLRLAFTVKNYMDVPVLSGRMETRLAPLEEWRKPIELPLNDMGVFTINLMLDAPGGRIVGEHHFLRLPKLEHPRLLFRKEEMANIRARIAKYPLLFRRYTAWLRRQCEKEGFLPPTLAPTYMSNEYHNVTPRWRVVACAFADIFLDDTGYFGAKIAPLLQKRTNLYETYHQARFGNALACLFDMVGAKSEQVAKQGHEYFEPSLGVSEFLAESLYALQEPLTPRMRAVLNQQMMWLVNVERYFQTHAGRNGGNWWLTTRTGCTCPLNSFGESFLLFRNVFGEESLFEKPFIRDTFTHQEYVHPLYDVKRFFGWGGLSGSQIWGAVASLTRHPVEKQRHGFDSWIAEMNGPLKEPEEKSVDQLMAKTFVAPIFLALGWLDPAAPTVAWEELPPARLFDMEGEASLKSDWRPDTTSVYFHCGLRDVAYHDQPTHFEIMKAGHVLIGNGSLAPEDGSPCPAWGNVVVVADKTRGEEWPLRWKANVGHPRRGEFDLMNRFTPASLYYTVRDRALCGFMPPYNLPGGQLYGNTGFHYGLILGLHGHSQHPFIQEGQILAFQTSPIFDYVAGDATNAWPVEQVREMFRQLVFLRDDVVVIYDRCVLGPNGINPCWLAATGPSLTTEGNRFTVKNETAILCGEFLLPARVKFNIEDSVDTYRYAQLFYQGQKVRQKILEVRPADEANFRVEFLTVMKTGVGEIEPIMAKASSTEDTVSVQFPMGAKQVAVEFRRSGPVGGHIKVIDDNTLIDEALAQKIEEGYERWSSDPRYTKWTKDPRFKFLRE